MKEASPGCMYKELELRWLLSGSPLGKLPNASAIGGSDIYFTGLCSLNRSKRACVD